MNEPLFATIEANYPTVESVLSCTVARTYFKNFLNDNFSVENILFYDEVTQLKNDEQLFNEQELKAEVLRIYYKFIQPGPSDSKTYMINVDHQVRTSITNTLMGPHPIYTWVVFQKALKVVLAYMQNDMWISFKQSPHCTMLTKTMSSGTFEPSPEPIIPGTDTMSGTPSSNKLDFLGKACDAIDEMFGLGESVGGWKRNLEDLPPSVNHTEPHDVVAHEEDNTQQGTKKAEVHREDSKWEYGLVAAKQVSLGRQRSTKKMKADGSSEVQPDKEDENEDESSSEIIEVPNAEIVNTSEEHNNETRADKKIIVEEQVQSNKKEGDGEDDEKCNEKIKEPKIN